MTHAGEVTVAPATSAWTEFEVTDVDGTVQIVARKGDVNISDGSGTSSTLPQGEETTRDESQTHKKDKRRGGGAVPAATGGALSSPYAIAIGAAAVGGVLTWVLIQGDEPVSPSIP
jgi:ferric-dicitrate binding protein FerR (iron transport regulator)